MPNIRQSNSERLQRLRAALRRAGPKSEISQQSLVQLWGSNNSSFTKVKQSVVGWPAETRTGQGAAKWYPARQALKLLIEVDQKEIKDQERRVAQERRIMGGVSIAPRDSGVTLKDLATISRLNAEQEERERAQRKFIAADEVANVMARVFNLLSGYHSQLANRIDQNGTLPAPVRAALDSAGTELLLKMSAELADMLDPDAAARRTDAPSARRKRGRPRRATPSR